jgi:uncharacterized protein with PQ loop repeat
MTVTAEIAITIFAISNSVRVLAYIPQIARVACDKQGAGAISYATWLLFAVSHSSTVLYAMVVINDIRMAIVFAANMLCCLLIVGLTAYKRARVSRGATALIER